MIDTPKIVVDTDVFLEHLWGTRKPSTLRLTLQKFFCYTTVFQAAELFSLAKSERERVAIEHAMACVKVLGLNARNAPGYGRILRKRGVSNVLCSLAGGLCTESRLPLLTDRAKEFRGIAGLVCVPTEFVLSLETGKEILSAVRRPGRRLK